MANTGIQVTDRKVIVLDFLYLRQNYMDLKGSMTDRLVDRAVTDVIVCSTHSLGLLFTHHVLVNFLRFFVRYFSQLTIAMAFKKGAGVDGAVKHKH